MGNELDLGAKRTVTQNGPDEWDRELGMRGTWPTPTEELNTIVDSREYTFQVVSPTDLNYVVKYVLRE